MAKELTFGIIKPNSIKANQIGDIIAIYEKNGLKLTATKMTRISKSKCEEFYAEHKARPFFSELVSFMTSGPAMLMVLSGEGAIARNREIMGATDPSKARPGTIRALFANSVGENSVHG